MCNKSNKNSIKKTNLYQNPTYIIMLPAAPPGLKARQDKRLNSRQKKLQRTTPHRNSLQRLPKKTQTLLKKQQEILHAKTISACAEGNLEASKEIRQMKRESQMPYVVLHEKTQICKKNLAKEISRLKTENRYLASEYLASYEKSKKRIRGKNSQPTFLKLIRPAAGHFLVVNICNSYYKRDWKYYHKKEKKSPLCLFFRK